MIGDGRDLVEVVLDDDVEPAPDPGDGRDAPHGADAADAADGADAAGRRSGPRRAPRVGRRLRRVAAACGVVVVLAAVGVDTLADRREQRAIEASADVPGVLASLADPPAERWQLPEREAVWGVRDVLVTVDPDAGLVGRDLATGTARWTLEGPPDVEPRSVLCGAEDDLSDLMVCLYPRLPATPAAPDPSTLVVVDPDDGTVVRTREPLGRLSGLALTEGGLVVAESTRAGVRVSLEDVRTGDARWRTELPGLGRGGGLLELGATEDVVSLEGTESVVLDAADGRELARRDAAGDGLNEATAHVVGRIGAGFGIWSSRFSGTWYGPDGARGAELGGEPVEPDVDDGSTPGVVLLGSPDGVLSGVDALSGERRWQRPAPERVLLRLRGRVVVTGDGRLEAIRVATGEPEWSTPLDDSQEPNLDEAVTDGVRVVLRGESDGTLDLTAYDLADGDQVWRRPLPDGSLSVRVLGDRLAAVRRTEASSADVLAVLG